MSEAQPSDSQMEAAESELVCVKCGYNLGWVPGEVRFCPHCGERVAAKVAEATVADARDLYCLECGYNLRGLSGDPRRCPECFHLNPVGSLLIPAADIRRQIRQMETAPAACIAAVLVAAVLTTLFAGTGGDCAAIILLPGAVIGWVAGVYVFGKSCRWKLGWKKALARFHFFSLAILTIGLGSWIVGMVRVRNWTPSGGSLTKVVSLVLVVAAIATVVLLFYRLIRWMCRQAIRDFEPLQREVAVEIIQTRHRRLLSRRR
ncbi:MAG: hypothetical protein ACYSUI_16145 [Planctomycetota bacterium]|jgi:predicted RNA-binding Zn-ribbon protein involved in translation (DUF1610 family)